MRASEHKENVQIDYVSSLKSALLRFSFLIIKKMTCSFQNRKSLI